MFFFGLATLSFCVLQISGVSIRNDGYILNLTPAEDVIQFELLYNSSEIRMQGTIGNISTESLNNCNEQSTCHIEEDGFILDILPEDHGFRLQWESNNTEHIFTDCITLSGSNWYGGPEMYTSYWPVEKSVINNIPYVTSKNNYGAISERLWLSSTGAYVFVDERVPLFVDQNNQQEGQLCFTAQLQPPYRGRERVLLSYVLIASENVREAYLHAVNNYLGKPSGLPNYWIVRNPIWTTWGPYKSNINDSVVKDFAQQISSYDLTGQIEIDDKWEDCYGSATFSNVTFPNIIDTIARIKDLGHTVTIWTHPFVNVECEAAQIGLDNDYFVKGEDGTLQVSWWNGEGYLIDFTNPEARDWYINRLRAIQQNYGVDNFKFDAGEIDWAPPLPVLNGDIELQPNLLTEQYVRAVAQFGDLIEVRSGSRTQDLSNFIRIMDKDSRWGNDNGLHALIINLLLFNIQGYTMVLPDLIGGNGYDVPPTPELLARWIQATVFMPAMQFSYLPWNVQSDEFNILGILDKFLRLRQEHLDLIHVIMQQSVDFGYPVNPPIWWMDPTNPDALNCDDEYLLGDIILVAPIIKEGARSRNVTLPAGIWQDGNNVCKLYEGPLVLVNYPAPIDVLPYFIYFGSRDMKARNSALCI